MFLTPQQAFGSQKPAEDYESSQKKQGKDQMDMGLWYQLLIIHIPFSASHYLGQGHCF